MQHLMLSVFPFALQDTLLYQCERYFRGSRHHQSQKEGIALIL